jgi:hypothetical protein
MGDSGRTRVMDNFLITTQLGNYLDMISNALQRQPVSV